MKPVIFAAAILLYPLACAAQQLHQQEIQRALIQLDQRSADFARGTVSPPLDPFVGRPLHPDPEIAQQLRPYERMRAAEANEPAVLRLPPPAARTIDRPLALPGRPPGALEPNPITSPRPAD
jgi:cell division septation protein DedD